jgi:hypothetical protein
VYREEPTEALQGEVKGRCGPPGVKDYLFLVRCAAAFARLPHTAMLHHRRPWAFVRSRNSNEQTDPSHARISRKSTGQMRSAAAPLAIFNGHNDDSFQSGFVGDSSGNLFGTIRTGSAGGNVCREFQT